MNKSKLIKKHQLFIILVLLYIVTLIINNKVLKTDELIINFYSEQFVKEQIEELIINQKKWYWLPYAMIPLIILIRTSLVALCLNIGLFFYDIENKIKFKQLFKTALLGEFVLVLVGHFKFLYFYFIKTDFTLLNLQQFHPLSYTNFLDLNKLEPWLIYPLQTINLFEIAYFFVLVYGLHKLLKNKYFKSFEIVAVSYGSGLVIWLGLVMFLTLNMS